MKHFFVRYMILTLTILLGILLVAWVSGDFAKGAEPQLSALKIIRENCVRCHSGDKPAGRLKLDSVDNMVRGGKSGPAVVPFWPDRSLIYKYITPSPDGQAGPMMPPTKRLSEDETAAIRQWIYNGSQQMSMGGREP